MKRLPNNEVNNEIWIYHPMFCTLAYCTLMCVGRYGNACKARMYLFCTISNTLNISQVKNRSRQLTKLFRSYETYSHLIGSTLTVLITEVSHDGQYYVGHTKHYEQVLIIYKVV